MAAPDRFALRGDPRPGSLQDPLTRPATSASVVSDANELPWKPRALHVSVAGNIKYTADGVTITEAFEVGWHPFRPDKIFATGTTATFVVWD